MNQYKCLVHNTPRSHVTPMVFTTDNALAAAEQYFLKLLALGDTRIVMDEIFPSLMVDVWFGDELWTYKLELGIKSELCPSRLTS